MTRTLLISVRFHDGRYHGAGDWPPSPARLFQALVAAAAQPTLDSAREALKWLEELDTPIIAAPAKHDGQHISLFVPNNDLDAKGGDIRRLAEIRSDKKHIRPRLFDASVPLLYVWRFDTEKNGDESKGICDIANDLYQLGRGVDMAWAIGEVLDETAAEDRLAEYRGVVYRPSEKGQGTKLDCPEEGSLDSLEIRYKASRKRFRRVGNGIEFAKAPTSRFRSVAYDSPATRLLFDLRRTTDAGSPFAPWPLKRTAALVQKLRDGAVAKMSQHFDDGTINKVLIGRDAKTEADKALRVRIIPLPSIGHVHADRSIRRVLVEVPPDCPIRADDVAWAFAGLEVAPLEVDTETGEIFSSPVELVRADDDSMLEHYGLEENRASRLWRSVTPLALSTARRRMDPAKQSKLEQDGAKQGSERQAENRTAIHEVVQALRHAGLRHHIADIRVQREPFEAKGERAEAFADGTRFSGHQLWHIGIEFAEPVHGPIVLGNGRFCGLGLMAPVRQVNGVHVFVITDGLTDDAEPLEIARSLRRAVMARVQGVLGKGEKLPLFFSGHEADGEPARSGAHAHLAFVPDLQRKRLLVIAPHVVEHREPTWDERGTPSKDGHLEILAQALTGFDNLNAGRSGKLRLAPQALVMDTDPLFAPSTRWAAPRGTYQPTRHAKKNGTDTLQSDVLREAVRRNLPAPQEVIINGDLSLRFKIAVPGPVLLGRNFHFGGGMFVNAAPSSSPFLNP